MGRVLALAVLGAFVGQGLHVVAAQEPGTVLGEQKLASGTGGFSGVLDNADHFGHALAALGDLDGDGAGDLTVGAPEDDDGGTNRGALWVLFLERDGTARAQTKISSVQGGFTGAIDNTDRFGCSLAVLGDLDGDGLRELAVGAEQDDDGGLNRGAVWVLSLDASGRVARSRKISQTSGGFSGLLRDGDLFGHALAALGDLDGDGVRELAVGASLDDDGGSGSGAVWVLFLDAQGSVLRQRKIGGRSGGFTGPLSAGDRFGSSLARLDDLDGDGTDELAVGAQQDDDGGLNRGAAWVLFLTPDGTVGAETKLSRLSGLAIDDSDSFGASVASPGDVDGDGTSDLVVGATLDDDGGLNRGAAWVLFLRSDGTLAGFGKISSLSGGLTGPLASNAFFGTALAALEDLDGDRMHDLAVGAVGDDTGGIDRGASWVLFLESAVLPSLVVRNGLGINPLLLSASDAPAVGSTWEAEVDCRGFHRGVVIHQVTDRPLDGPVLGRLGQRLIPWNRPCFMRVVARHFGKETVIRHRVPAVGALVGVPFYSQAHVTGRGGARLTNALDGEFVEP